MVKRHTAFSNMCRGAPLQLVYLKIAGLLFPASDLRHPVVTPALVCMSQLLTKVRARWRAWPGRPGEAVRRRRSGPSPGKAHGEGRAKTTPEMAPDEVTEGVTPKKSPSSLTWALFPFWLKKSE